MRANTTLGEFEIIRDYFTRQNEQVLLGVGDDCALLHRPKSDVAICTDMLLEGRHFFPDVSPFSLGHKSLAVNLSDLAAMGAKPLGFTLGIALPHADHDWLHGFSSGLFALAEKYACPLIGGDTTRSEHGVQITITAIGEVHTENAIRRDGAKKGDDIWVSGHLGAAGFVVEQLKQTCPSHPHLIEAARPYLEMPEPRVILGQQIAGLASAGLDVSDGLLQDLKHVLKASQVGAKIELGHLPIAPCLAELPLHIQRMYACTGGDEYELCFTASPAHRKKILELAHELALPLTRIGVITAQTGVQLHDNERLLPDSEAHVYLKGFQHFHA